ncbi:hypothetical protein HDZ31DRAFT_48024 [Schizophyllum fasciatum]
MVGTLIATKLALPDRELAQETDSQMVQFMLTRWRAHFEDIGFIGKKNARLARALIAAMRDRPANTKIKWVKGHNGYQRNEEADKLANAGARKDEPDEVDIKVPSRLKVTGAKLSCMTQALAYRAIRTQKSRKTAARPASERNIDRIQAALQDAFGVYYTKEKIWRSIEKKALLVECQNFMWMATHDAYMIGKKWLEVYDGSKPEHEEKRKHALCQRCEAIESMDHILFECEAAGQTTVWKLAKAVWERTGREWQSPSFGLVMGAACPQFLDDDGDRLTHLERLWTILISCSGYLIWKLRCERVIQNENKEFHEREVEGRWFAEMNSRLDLDRRMTHKRYEKKRLSEGLVEFTWRPVIPNYESLPPKWVSNSGVLVGIKGG